MAKKKRDNSFWTSYSDLMTSLFFVMLVLFVLTITLLNKRVVDIEGERRAIEEERKATQEQLDKIREIEEAIKGIDSTYFEYNDNYKKHVLKISVNFPVGVSKMDSIDPETKNELIEAGKSIIKSIKNINKEHPGIQYLLIIEGQASKDSYPYNYELSYNRALSLSRFWHEKELHFGDNCEVLISGSGTGGTMREEEEAKNQRFLIHLLPKPGVIEISKSINTKQNG